MNQLEQAVVQIRSIFGGQSAVYDSAGQDQFLDSIAIDPEISLGSLVKPSGVIAPTRYSKFSSLLSSPPMWISGGPTTAGVFVYEMNGSVLSYGAALTSGVENFVGDISGYGGGGNGMVLYNDYVYCSTASTISRYGRLSATNPQFTYDYWVGSLAQSSLTNSAYPSTRNVNYPNHVMHFHTDGNLYIADYDGKNGRIHYLTTDYDGANGTATWAAVSLPPGYLPMDMKSYGTYLAVLATPDAKYASGALVNSGNAALFLWDTVSRKITHNIKIAEQLATALINKNGELYVTAGNIDSYVKLLHYLGGYSFAVEAVVNEGTPPPAGAAEANGNMVAWGGHMTVPATAAGAFALGFRNGQLPGGALNQIARISDAATGTLPIVSALKFIERNNTPLLGWRTDTPANYGIDKRGGSAAYNSIFDTGVFQIGKKFLIRRIIIPLSAAISSGVTITPTVFVDNEAASTQLTVINNTNYPSSERIIDMQGLSIPGYSNFYIRFAWTGTTEIAIIPPITIEYDVYS